MKVQSISGNSYATKLVHTLSGIFLLFFLLEHLLTNSQAALYFGKDGEGFLRAVEFIHSLPYLHAIEVFCLGFPIIAHTILGIQRIRSSKLNSFPTSGKNTTIAGSYTNHAFSMQRILSIVVLIGLIGHVWSLRFYKHPKEFFLPLRSLYIAQVSFDEGIDSLAKRLRVGIMQKNQLERRKFRQFLHTEDKQIQRTMETQIIDYIEKTVVDAEELYVITDSFSKALLFIVRDTFKSPIMCLVYSLFVFATSYHAAHGLWTSMITLGITRSIRLQNYMQTVAFSLFFILLSLGFIAIWGTYWINLRT